MRSGSKVKAERKKSIINVESPYFPYVFALSSDRAQDARVSAFMFKQNYIIFYIFQLKFVCQCSLCPPPKRDTFKSWGPRQGARMFNTASTFDNMNMPFSHLPHSHALLLLPHSIVVSKIDGISFLCLSSSFFDAFALWCIPKVYTKDHSNVIQ